MYVGGAVGNARGIGRLEVEGNNISFETRRKWLCRGESKEQSVQGEGQGERRHDVRRGCSSLRKASCYLATPALDGGESALILRDCRASYGAGEGSTGRRRPESDRLGPGLCLRLLRLPLLLELVTVDDRPSKFRWRPRS